MYRTAIDSSVFMGVTLDFLHNEKNLGYRVSEHWVMGKVFRTRRGGELTGGCRNLNNGQIHKF